ncbi:MAG: hypothetical protein U1F46_02890 [Marinagarivorans sp.]
MLTAGCDNGSLGGALYSTPDVEIYLSCRHKSDNSAGNFGDIALIQMNKNTGATCFYQAFYGAEDDFRRPILDPNNGGFKGWEQSDGMMRGCMGCHNNGGLIRSPYFAATTVTKHNVPGTGIYNYYTNNSPHWNVEYPDQETYTIQTNDSTCSGCHRLSALKSGSGFDTGGTSSNYALASTAANYGASSASAPD